MNGNVDYEALVKTQQAKKLATRVKVLAALGAIEKEIEEHGFYPANDGKVTLTEVARRAGIGGTTLRNTHHHETRKLVQKWLKNLKNSAATTKPKARAVARDKIAWYEDSFRKMNAQALKWRSEQPENKIKESHQAAISDASKVTNVVPLIRPRDDDDSCN